MNFPGSLLLLLLLLLLLGPDLNRTDSTDDTVPFVYFGQHRAERIQRHRLARRACSSPRVLEELAPESPGMFHQVLRVRARSQPPPLSLLTAKPAHLPFLLKAESPLARPDFPEGSQGPSCHSALPS